MFRLSLSLAVLFVLPLAGCAVQPAPAPSDLEVDPLAAAGSGCDLDTDCMPTGKECGVIACIESACQTQDYPAGTVCNSGVGFCGPDAECQYPKGRCKEWGGYEVTPCDDPSECDDGTPCTADTCQAGWCAHSPLPDGQACGGALLSCKQGLCCVPD